MSMLHGLKWVFSNQGQGNINAALINARQTLSNDIKNKQTQIQVEKFEEVLNSLFYGPEPPDYVLDYQKKMSESAEKTILERFNAMDLEASINGSSSYNQYVKDTTVINKISKIKQQLIKIQGMALNTKSAQDMIKVENTINQIISEAEAAFQQVNAEYDFAFDKGGQYISFATNAGARLKEALIKLDNMNKAIANGQNPNNLEVGNFLEEALTASAKNAVENMTNDVFDDLVGKKTGDTPVVRGETGILSYIAKVSGYRQNQIKGSKNSNFKISKKNMTATYSYNPGAEKKGKMDVQIQYQDGTGDIRISAKNWQSSASKSLGETSIDAAIARTSGRKIIEYYRFALIDASKDQYKHSVTWQCAQSAHELAKLAIAADIAMGISQKENYANILVVDTGSAIRVRDLSKLLQGFEQNDGMAVLQNYNEQKIEKDIQNDYRKIRNTKSPGRSESFQAFAASTLNGIKVSLNLQRAKLGI